MEAKRVSRADVDDRVAQRLTENGIRYTHGRRLAVQALLDLAGPVTASQLQQEIGDAVPLSSLYRTLSRLDETAIIERTHDGDGVARYELGEWLLGHHHHLVCNRCGAVVDVSVTPALEANVAEMVEAIAHEAGYLPTGHRMDIEGVCGSCQK